ncbi:MAG: F0F1 ATP synthase subunit epsilon [Methylophilaceae bacterium]|jgi:F-type H+-transporting ATPase subunit epsilon
MASTIQIDVVSAEESIFTGQAEFIVAPALMGEVGIFPRHTPMLTTIKPGALRIKLPNETEEQLIFVSGGILEVQPGLVTVLADTAIRGHDLDEAKALEVKRLAEETLKGNASEVNYAQAQVELAEALAQLQAISKLRKKVH